MAKEHLSVERKLYRVEKKRLMLIPEELRAVPAELVALPKPKLSLDEEILRHIDRLRNPSAADLHNYIKQYAIPIIRDTCESLVQAGKLTIEQTSHTIRYRKASL